MDSFVVSDVRLYDGEKILANASVLVRDGVIHDVGTTVDSGDLPILRRPGHTLIPGLIEAHCHPEGELQMSEQAIRFGITTLLDLQNVHEQAVQQKKWSRERKDLPDVKSAHFGATIHNGWPTYLLKQIPAFEGANYDDWPDVRTVDDAERYLQRAVENGSDYIKLFHEGGKAWGFPAGAVNHPDESVQASLVVGAHKRGLKVIGHAMSREDTIAMLRSGVDGLAHTFFDAPLTSEIIEHYKKNNVWLNPTLGVIGSATADPEFDSFITSLAEDPRVTSRLSNSDQTANMHRCLNMHAKESKWEYAIDSVRQLKAAGIDIISGSDAAPGLQLVFGAGLYVELYLLVTKVGFTPEEALQSATSLTARRFGFEDRGRIAKGLKADMVLVEGDPTTDITSLLDVREVWRDGVALHGAAE